jgi:hypothetical protein
VEDLGDSCETRGLVADENQLDFVSSVSSCSVSRIAQKGQNKRLTLTLTRLDRPCRRGCTAEDIDDEIKEYQSKVTELHREQNDELEEEEEFRVAQESQRSNAAVRGVGAPEKELDFPAVAPGTHQAMAGYM